MKACVFQLQYSNDLKRSDELFEKKLKMLDECEKDCDIIVLPEYSDVPCAVKTVEELEYYHNKYIDVLLSKCSETAKRCDSLVFVNALSNVEGKFRNTTYAFGRNGVIIGKYYKTHIPPSEKVLNVDFEYTKETEATYILEVDGIRYAFLTCYDFYFYEAYAKIARNNVDIIIGCSLQRSDTHDSIEAMCRFLAYNTNAYVLRSSVSFDENSAVCGASMIVSPEGKVLANMEGKFGKCTAEFNPHEKYLKPAGFGRGLASNYEYIEEGRNPWQYRPAGSAICLDDNNMSYPRLCAHRGFNTIAPENSMPAFGAAVALGASEIEFDLWATKDRELVSLHDSTIERVSDGSGNVWDYTFDELLHFDFGFKKSEKFKGLKIVKFEEILKKFSCHVIMNIHVKIWDMDFEDNMIDDIVKLIKEYDCEKHVYFMTTNDKILKILKNSVPQINICVGHDSTRPYEIVNRAIEIGAQKVQLFKPYFNQEMIDKAHKNGIRCNVFWTDDPLEARKFLDMGIDTLLTNDYQNISFTTGIK
jgi:glycerophosphoryl diester phosphodiesterase/predicted amidohydrolase